MMKIIDNFFKDPHSVRKFALGLEYEGAIHGQWPGVRIPIPEPQKTLYTKQYQKFFDEPADPYRMFFQSVGELWGEGLVHSDPESKYTVLTFLNVESPSNSGIEIYNRRIPEDDRRIDAFESIKTDFYRSKKNPIERFFFEKKVKSYNSYVKDPCIVPNQFNRTVIFDGSRMHRAQNFFGNNLFNSRLTMISFFGKREPSPPWHYD